MLRAGITASINGAAPSLAPVTVASGSHSAATTSIFSAQPVATKAHEQSTAGQGRVKRLRALTVFNQHEICKKRKEEKFAGMKLGNLPHTFLVPSPILVQHSRWWLTLY
jgi:hypothetical protein